MFTPAVRRETRPPEPARSLEASEEPPGKSQPARKVQRSKVSQAELAENPPLRADLWLDQRSEHEHTHVHVCTLHGRSLDGSMREPRGPVPFDRLS